jgi:DNA-binding XRE family transcriptional regulator
MTTGPHPHPLAGDCPLACLAGLITNHALGAITQATGYRRDSRIADVAAIVRDGHLAAERYVGPAKAAEAERVLHAAGLISQSDCRASAALAARRDKDPRWRPVNGPLIRDLRLARGWSQAALALNAGVSASTIRKIEAGFNPHCQARIVENIAAVLEHLPESLTPAGPAPEDPGPSPARPRQSRS